MGCVGEAEIIVIDLVSPLGSSMNLLQPPLNVHKRGPKPKSDFVKFRQTTERIESEGGPAMELAVIAGGSLKLPKPQIMYDLEEITRCD